MILADTSVWIDYLNGIQSKHTDTLDTKIAEGAIVMGDLISLEILQGIRDDREYRLTKRALSTLDQYAMFGKGMSGKCAENYRALRKKGITVRKTTDVIIATFCIEQRLPLLFTDRDFIPFTEHLGLLSVPVKT
ncbi:MAG: PIN domain nuclease [Pseudomonadales bacterium]|jgi:predicted nucleic acid-binding protein|nr:PIN domain nuclease [Pseudomonadales bacterium]